MEKQSQAVKVNCSFCGKEIECPEDMFEKTEKHMCFECFQNPSEEIKKEDLRKVHIDIPFNEFDENIPETMTNSIVEDIFPEIWQERKKELKEMGKKELAEEMFGAGIYIATSNMIKIMKQEFKAEAKKGSKNNNKKEND